MYSCPSNFRPHANELDQSQLRRSKEFVSLTVWNDIKAEEYKQPGNQVDETLLCAVEVGILKFNS